MESQNFEWFIDLLNKQTYDNVPSYSLLHDFNLCFPKLKADILKYKVNNKANFVDCVEMIKAEVIAQDINLDADISYIQKWLDKYDLKIEDILNQKIYNKDFELLFQNEYKYFDRNSIERDEAAVIHIDFFNYLKNHFVIRLFEFLDSQIIPNKVEKAPTTPQIIKSFKDQFLTAFLNEISDLNSIYDSTFIQCYEFGIKRHTDSLISEIKENILIIPSDKLNPYFEFIEDKISSTPFYNTKPGILDKWVKKYNIKNLEFPFLENENINHLITKSINYHLWDDKERFQMEEIQQDFFYYASMIEATKITDFIETKKYISTSKPIMNESEALKENTNQLTVNQSIILLDKLGIFNDKAFDRVSNVKKAKLISQLLGKNWKNIKTSIESLEKKPSELGTGYQKDIDKIQKLLDNLE